MLKATTDDWNGESAFALLKRLHLEGLELKTGVESLDHIVSLAPGEVYEIDGDFSAGKTQLCYSIVARLLSVDEDAQVVWLSPLRMRTGDILKHSKDDTLLDRVVVAKITNVETLKSKLSFLEGSLRGSSVRLVVIDSISCILHDTVWQTDAGRRNSTQKTIVAKIRSIANCGVTVVMTNHITFWRGYPAPTLGDFWIASFKNRFLVEKEVGIERRILSLQKNDDDDDSIECRRFYITHCGLQSADSDFSVS